MSVSPTRADNLVLNADNSTNLHLGTIVLARAPLLASGVVADETDAPVEHVRVHLVQSGAADPRFRRPSDPSRFDTSREEYAARSGADGSFALLGDPGRGTFAL